MKEKFIPQSILLTLATLGVGSFMQALDPNMRVTATTSPTTVSVQESPALPVLNPELRNIVNDSELNAWKKRIESAGSRVTLQEHVGGTEGVVAEPSGLNLRERPEKTSPIARGREGFYTNILDWKYSIRITDPNGTNEEWVVIFEKDESGSRNINIFSRKFAAMYIPKEKYPLIRKTKSSDVLEVDWKN